MLFEYTSMVPRRRGNTGRIPISPDVRFWCKVRALDNGCWEWTGYLQPNGYGRLNVGSRMTLAHRWAYERLIGPIPRGLQSDHLCRNRACVNPLHIEPTTAREN